MKRLLKFVRLNHWVFAKTMPETPHWYVYKTRCDHPEDFPYFVQQIWDNGEDVKFGKSTWKYLTIGGFKYWAMGWGSADRVMTINRALVQEDKQTSIEYCHTYINESFNGLSGESIRFMEFTKAVHPAHQLAVMVDDYSPGIPDRFDYKSFLDTLQLHNATPDILVKESALLGANLKTLNTMPDNKVKTSIKKYIDKYDKHPCSLFIASWYLYRLGHLQTADIAGNGVIRNEDFKPADRLINVLPKHFKSSENKATEILTQIDPAIPGWIDNIYIDSPRTSRARS